jgi:hypothetical protein
MRALAALLCALAAMACTPQAQRCDLSFAREVAFTSAEARDAVTVRALGPSCDKAIGVFAVRDGEDRPVWAWAAPLQHSFGDVFAADEPEAMQTFLERWAEPVIATTGEAPAWDALAPGATTLDQLTYEDIRARNLPMLCHFSGTARQVCAFWEPVAGGAGLFYERDVQESEP